MNFRLSKEIYAEKGAKFCRRYIQLHNLSIQGIPMQNRIKNKLSNQGQKKRH
jgi:hypothetical protein